MDKQAPFIVDEVLPEALNFDALKREAITRLQSMVGEYWTNFNDSDPGVTILDQLCYALTELGYCANFAIEDVLTRPDGTIAYDAQFFAPQEILTTSPVTIEDYRKLVHDRFETLDAVYIVAETCDAGRCSGRYLTRIASATGDGEALCRSVQALLNGNRNLGEWFLLPTLLRARPVALEAQVHLSDAADPAQVMAAIERTLGNYAAPAPLRAGYGELRAAGLAADEIFNGPALAHGWMGGAGAPGPKRDEVDLFEVSTLLGAIEGVLYVDGLGFAAEAGATHIAIAADEIASLRIHAVLVRDGVPLANGAVNQADAAWLGALERKQDAASVGAAVDQHPPLPHGRYRNIEQYLSVQLTFPEAYGIGQYGVPASQGDYRIARARQLKGYLLVFDQLLANQFSQLAHVGQLFSWRPASQEPPAAAVPSYFCQPLYTVPDVKPLLRGTDAFRFQFDPAMPASLAEREAWQRYTDWPYNPYILGLRRIMESDTQAEQRRERMLNHLMARHGEDGAQYDEMIGYAHWYGSAAMTRIVVKSIWLQQYRLLSYHRNRAPANAGQADLPTLAGMDILQGPAREAFLPSIDGRLDEAAVYAAAALSEADLEHHSAFELKLHILLNLGGRLNGAADKLAGLMAHAHFEAWQARDAGAPQDAGTMQVHAWEGGHRLMEDGRPLLDIEATGGRVEKSDYARTLRQLRWLAGQRKGCLLIEHQLLVPEALPPGPAHGLCATLVLPRYASPLLGANFNNFIATIVGRHWPAHVSLTILHTSQAVLQCLIERYVEWRRQPAGSGARAAAGQVISRLLQLDGQQRQEGAGNHG